MASLGEAITLTLQDRSEDALKDLPAGAEYTTVEATVAWATA